MSGGSYDYTCYEMSEGRVDKAIQNAERALSDFDEFAKVGLTEIWENGKRREPTEREKVFAEAGLGCLRRKLVEFAQAADKLSKQAESLSDVFRTLEWIRSSDYSPNQLAEEALKWAQERLK